MRSWPLYAALGVQYSHSAHFDVTSPAQDPVLGWDEGFLEQGTHKACGVKWGCERVHAL